MTQVSCDIVAAAIRAQYSAILQTHNSTDTTEGSLALRFNDQNASLVMTVQNSRIIMAQLTPRNLYPGSPDLAPTPYTDIDADGILETYPGNKNTHIQSSLTYGTYLALLTRFGLPQEVAQEKVLPSKIPHKDRKFDIAKEAIPSSPEIFSHIVR
jgi:hypothetical protein